MNVKNRASNRISCVFAIFMAKSGFYCFAQILFTFGFIMGSQIFKSDPAFGLF